jgi:hypothetical protein
MPGRIHQQTANIFAVVLVSISTLFVGNARRQTKFLLLVTAFMGRNTHYLD